MSVVLPSLSNATPLRVVETVVVAVPFLVFGARAAPSAPPVPVAGLALAVSVGLVATASPRAARARIAVLAACVLGLVPLLSNAGIRSVPPGVDAWVLGSADRTPSAPGGAGGARAAAYDLLPDPWRGPDGADARRPGALAPAPAPSAWTEITPPVAKAGARWLGVPPEATSSLPARGPVVLVVAAPRVDLPSAAGGATFVAREKFARHALDLDPYDAVLLLPHGGGAAEPAAESVDAVAADALASFARRGGLLIGPVHPDAWPLGLDRRLGDAGASVGRGPDGAKPFGVGRLARAQSTADVATLLDEGLGRARLGTVFDRATIAPPSPLGWARWADDPASRGPLAPLVLAYAVAVAAAGLWRGARRGAAVVLLAALAGVGLALVAERPSGVRVQPFRLDLGGAGGRRVEGLLMTAGPDGWAQSGPMRAPPNAALRVLGFDVLRDGGAGRLSLDPGRDGWIVSESIALAEGDGPPAVADVPAWAETLLRRGDPDLSDLRFRAGRARYGGPTLGGIGEVPDAQAFAAEPIAGR